mgnify:CR=1 FL=1
MNKVIIVGGGAAGMMAAISASKAGTIIRLHLLKRMKSLERSFLLQEKADVILQMPVRRRNFLRM